MTLISTFSNYSHLYQPAAGYFFSLLSCDTTGSEKLSQVPTEMRIILCPGPTPGS